MRIDVTQDGPYEVSGGVPLAKQAIEVDGSGTSVGWREGEALHPEGAAQGDTYWLCRCGHSGNKPYCDGTHKKIGFVGTETATRAPYLDQAQEIDGPERILTDDEVLCAYARFCDGEGGIWRLVQEEGTTAVVEREGGQCPSGRLVVWDREAKKAVEPRLPASIGVVEDEGEKVSGPLWVRGGIEVRGADGSPYEVRNRQTLCRCGASRNKPFCDGSHASTGFEDGTF
ncbi:CDGSH iron-sulfur domain-containing protein [Streptomyces polyrhachis]|uniref:CDGSH iron-sulfur domain-containing protein n=1 Tax=Streptomyces polyrhachis TaxID=1282885 RepID=A0ABW2GE84_9ACTN